MAAAPVFAATPVIGAGLTPATLDLSLTAPTNTTTILTGGTNGTKIEEITVQGVGVTVAGIVNLFVHDGTTAHLIDQFAVTALTPSATVAAFQLRRQYQNLVLPTTSHTLRVSCSIAGLQATVKVIAVGGDF